MDYYCLGNILSHQIRLFVVLLLLQSKNRHAAALDLLEKLTLRPESMAVQPRGAAAELPGLPGVWAAVKYLTTLGAPDFALMSYHARWIIQGDPEAGVDMFVHLYPDVDPSVVLPVLAPFGSGLAAAYLQRIIDSTSSQGEQYEQELAGLYLQSILSGAADASISKKMTELVRVCNLIYFARYYSMLYLFYIHEVGRNIHSCAV